MYKKNNGSTEQEILQNQFSAYVKKAVHNRRIQFLTEKSRKFRFETPLFDLDYLLFDTTDIIQEITDHETVRQALRSIKENERRIVLERIIEEKSFGQLSDELGMSYKTVLTAAFAAGAALVHILTLLFQHPTIWHTEAGRNRFLYDTAVQIHLLRQIARIEP